MELYRRQIAETVNRIYPEAEISFTTPPDPSLGDISLPCFILARSLRRNPAIIASELKEVLDDTLDFIDKTEIKGGYLNIYINRTILFENTVNEILNSSSSYGSAMSGKGMKALVEHTSINPNASPHVGRARNALIGDCIVRLLRFEGYDVDVRYFVNDIGKQIAMLLLGATEKEAVSGKDAVNFQSLLDIYVDINNKAAENPALEKEVFELLYKLENGDEAIRDLFRNLVNICINGQTAIFSELGIKYDTFDYESDYIYKGTTSGLLKKLRSTGKLEEDEEGRLVLNQSEYSLPLKAPYLVLTRKDKTSLYPLRDIAYTIDKVTAAPGMNIVVLGEDQKLYFQQVAAALDLLGYKAPIPVHYSFVLLAEGKMATRKGNVVLLEDFMKEAVSKASAEIEKRRGSSDSATATAIGYGAVKYAILRASNDKNVVFDWDAALSFEGESGPYLQYSLARINSIFRKLAEAGYSNSLNSGAGPVDFSVLDNPLEVELIKEAASFSQAVKTALRDYSPHVIANYVYGLTKKFSIFYHDCPVLNAGDDKLKTARIALIAAVRQVILNAFYLLGIEPVEMM